MPYALGQTGRSKSAPTAVILWALTRLTRFLHAEIVICIQMKIWKHAGTVTIAGMGLIGREA
jgi:hypothetical protein